MSSRSPKLLIFLTVFIDLLGFGIMIPIYGYIARDYTTNWLLIGLLGSVYSLGQMVFAPFWGRLSDQYGRRPIILLSLAGSTASYALFAVSRNIEFLLLARAIGGICGGNLSAAQAYIADITPPEKRTEGMGLIGMAFGLGFVFGPVLGGIAVAVQRSYYPEISSQIAPGVLAAVICGTNLLWAIKSLPESLPATVRGTADATAARRIVKPGDVFGAISQPLIGPLIWVFFLMTLAFANMETGFGLYIKETIDLNLEEHDIYKFYIFMGLVLAAMQGGVVKRLVKFIPESVLVIVGAVLQSIGLALLPSITSVTNISVACFFIAMGQSLTGPCLLALVSKAAPPDRVGQTMGITQAASSMARVLGPMLATSAIAIGESAFKSTQTGVRFPFWSGGALMVFAAAMAVITRNRLLRAPLPEQTPKAA